MIKMTDNQQENKFAFFCDYCGREIKDRIGECLFEDTKPHSPVLPIFVHYECGKKLEKATGEYYGNMSLQDFVASLANV